MRKILILSLVVALLACGSDDNPEVVVTVNDLATLSVDQGGTHRAVPLQPEGPDYPYYIYEPSGYALDTAAYPLLIYLHGVSDFADPGVQNDLDKLLRNGPPRLIEQNAWHPDYPMIVVSPQLLITDLDWQPNKLHGFIEYLETNYRINPSRIYITGISIGGVGIFEYIRNLGSQQKAAAVVPIAGAGEENLVHTFGDVPLWAFHGEADRVIPFARGSKVVVDAINARNPRFRALVTTYPGVGHDAWTMTYNESGMGTENPRNDRFDQSVFSWMLNRKKK